MDTQLAEKTQRKLKPALSVLKGLEISEGKRE